MEDEEPMPFLQELTLLLACGELTPSHSDFSQLKLFESSKSLLLDLRELKGLDSLVFHKTKDSIN